MTRLALFAVLIAPTLAHCGDSPTFARLTVEPAAAKLDGPRARLQLIVTGLDAQNRPFDLTRTLAPVIDRPEAIAVEGGTVLPRADGPVRITFKHGTLSAETAIAVSNVAAKSPVSFRREIMGVLNVGGCSAGACHGTPSGKNGFKLSLRGFDPAADLVQLTRDRTGRRTNVLAPEQSLLFAKATGATAHDGGARFGRDSFPARLLAEWMAQGMPNDPPTLPAVTRLELLPGSRALQMPATEQQLSAVAYFADGSSADVTELTNYTVSDPSIADVDHAGLLKFKGDGEVAVQARYLETLSTIRLSRLTPNPAFVWPNPPENNFIDKAVFAKLRRLFIAPSELASDAEFFRRASLDIRGSLPTADEARKFLADPAKDKRATAVDRFLADERYADFWALKWADVLRSNRRSIQLKGAIGFRLWLREQFLTNEPFNEVAREILTASGDAREQPAANYFRIARDPLALAETTAQLFLGVRLQCAKCHNHPFERWSQDDYYGFAAFFAETKLRKFTPAKDSPEAVFVARSGRVTQPRTGKVMAPTFLGDGPAKPGRADDRGALADWITKPDNSFFARSVVNRVWYHMTGRGVVEPVDDFRESNPPSNDELLASLAADFVAHKYDLKHLIRTIAASRVYQLSSVPNTSNRDDAKYNSHSLPKLVPAEALLDAISDVTGVPEKFAGLPTGTRAIQLPDGEGAHPFLKAFGQPGREAACECERESDSNVDQALQLMNGPTLNDKLRSPAGRLARMLDVGIDPASLLNEFSLAALGRPATDEERGVMTSYLAKAKDARAAWEDLIWAMLNTREFLYRH